MLVISFEACMYVCTFSQNAEETKFGDKYTGIQQELYNPEYIHIHNICYFTYQGFILVTSWVSQPAGMV